jgi:hypothetical protein
MISLPLPRSIFAYASVAAILALLPGASLHADEPVVWTNAVGVSVSGNNLSKTAAAGWDAGAASVQTIRDGYGYVEFTATETDTHRMCGLSYGDDSRSYTDIDFARGRSRGPSEVAGGGASADGTGHRRPGCVEDGGVADSGDPGDDGGGVGATLPQVRNGHSALGGRRDPGLTGPRDTSAGGGPKACGGHRVTPGAPGARDASDPGPLGALRRARGV